MEAGLNSAGEPGERLILAFGAGVSKQFIFMSLARQDLIRIASYIYLCRLAD
jgi:hypothetical protein